MELKTARGRLFLVIALIVWLPLLNYCFKFIDSGRLDGVSPKPELQPFSVQNWWDGSYQQQRNTLINDSIGFRPDLVRMNNTADYLLFRKLNANSVILGLDDYLLDINYVNEYSGVSYMGDSTARHTSIQLRMIQDTLARLGKALIIAYTPLKSDFYREKIPPYLRRAGHHRSNVEGYLYFGDSLHLHQLDFGGWFRKMKDTSRYGLMTKQGIHWSQYGALLAADSMIKLQERLLGIHMPHPRITRIEKTDIPRESDADLGNILNLLTPIGNDTIAYPQFEFSDTAGKKKPKGIYIGDSFLWFWVTNHMLEGMNHDWEFWNHFNEVWKFKNITGQEDIKYMKDYNWQAAVGSADCIVIMFNPINLRAFTHKAGFVQQLYKYYYPAK